MTVMVTHHRLLDSTVTRIGAVSWIAGAGIFLLGNIIAQLAWNTPYSLRNNNISELLLRMHVLRRHAAGRGDPPQEGPVSPVFKRLGAAQPEGRHRHCGQGMGGRWSGPRDSFPERPRSQGDAPGSYSAGTRAHAPRPHRPFRCRRRRKDLSERGGNYIDTAAHCVTWGRAREATLTLDEHALNLAKQPYDLRHAGI
ncbi:hypothetical protein [Streptomyces sp. NPDC047061]|uniref:hypothetical protein n=1 Tax=Streptomyces sp. NPDC047061 TaxID=3154605 RepID=UPI0034091B62